MYSTIRQYAPSFVLQAYHWLLAKVGALLYCHPSRKLVVIGVTGTKGKSTVVTLIRHILQAAGHKTGLVSTINFAIGETEWKNETKQTMPGRFTLQKLLRKMVQADCRYAVIETSSEGIAQFRHLGIEYDVVVFTNLSPEHIESHGSYEKYRRAKLKLFQRLNTKKRKIIDGQEIKKIMVANHDDKEAENFLFFPADKKYTFGLKNISGLLMSDRPVVAREVSTGNDGLSFLVNEERISMELLGEFNVYNAMAAICVGLSQDITLPVIKQALASVTGVPGRMQIVPNKRGILIFVDYAHEPASLEAVYQTVKSLRPRKIISVLGSQGGGRDRAKRPVLGRLAADYTDHVIVTNEDPYDEDPEQIIDEVIAGALRAHGKPPIEKIIDRKEAIKKALEIAEPKDCLIITGKGSETVMAVAKGKKIPWSDLAAVKESLGKL